MSDRGGLLKAHAESFARRLQSRLQSLNVGGGASEDGWGSDTETFYDLESPPVSPDEEVAEPIFIAEQNKNSLPLQRSDSEASTYFDTVQDVQELDQLLAGNSRPNSKNVPRAFLHHKNEISTTKENGHSDETGDRISKLSFENEPEESKTVCNGLLNDLPDKSDCLSCFDMSSLRLELETANEKNCAKCAFLENSVDINVQEKHDSDMCSKYDCEVLAIDISHRLEEVTPLTTEDHSNNLNCVFCDIEEIKSNFTTDPSASKLPLSGVGFINKISVQLSNGFLEQGSSGNDLYLTESKTKSLTDPKIQNTEEMKPQVFKTTENIALEGNKMYKEQNVPLTDMLQVLKKEMLEDRKSNFNDVKNGNITCPTIQISRSPSIDKAESIAVEEMPKMKTEIDEFDIEIKRKNFKRSSSLKSGKTPPGTPVHKKIVRFADVLGLDLANVKTFLDEVPTVPMSAFEDLPNADSTSSPTAGTPVSSLTVICPQSVHIEKTLVPLFQQPSLQPNFLERVRVSSVCLENAILSDLSLFAITGLVRVKNIDYSKSVYIRYTINSWKNFSDLQARYVPNSYDGFSDKFSFVLYAHTLSTGQRLEFAVKFQAGSAQFWDNNGGKNYVFECTTVAPTRTFTLPDIDVPLGTASFY